MGDHHRDHRPGERIAAWAIIIATIVGAIALPLTVIIVTTIARTEWRKHHTVMTTFARTAMSLPKLHHQRRADGVS